MRNCQRRRPCCGGNQGGSQLPNPSPGCGCVETIVEPTVHCQVPDRHHHRRVRHIIPVVHHQAHHHHTHHEFEVRRRHTHEHNHHEHGRRPQNLCGLGSGSAVSEQGEAFEGASFDQSCDNGEEFFM